MCFIITDKYLKRHMVYQPDNAYKKKYGHQFGQYVTNPDNHLAERMFLRNILILRKKRINFHFSMEKMVELN